MSIENFNLEEKGGESKNELEKELLGSKPEKEELLRKELLRKLPPELREIHHNKSIEEIEKVIQKRENIGYVKNPPDISKLHVNENLKVETEETHREEIRKKLEEGLEQL